MTTYVYKSTTGFPVNIDNYIISPILGAASTVYSLPFTDIYGYPNRSDLKICGAVQDVSNIS